MNKNVSEKLHKRKLQLKHESTIVKIAEVTNQSIYSTKIKEIVNAERSSKPSHDQHNLSLVLITCTTLHKVNPTKQTRGENTLTSSNDEI